MSQISTLIQNSISSRSKLLEKLHNENTNAYRLFHGINDDWEGLNIDRYGDSILIQTFREALTKNDLEDIKEIVYEQMSIYSPNKKSFIVYNHRGGNKEKDVIFDNPTLEQDLEKRVFQEMGLNYIYQGRHRGQDPFLFLDMRAGRRFVLNNSKGLSFLNLFSYTNASGICAIKGGAKSVLNLDFSESSLAIGKENAEINNINQDNYKSIKTDVFSALRQFSGIPFKGRNAKNNKESVLMEKQSFDIVFLDPPAWSKSPYGTIDLIRDYQSIFKLALLATSDCGKIIAVNNVGKVQLNDWLEILKKCAIKAGREISNIEIIEPEDDFPSKDKKYPLKIAVCSV
jgi:23S rRNA (cytosine1962-C5)-methyltransferase